MNLDCVPVLHQSHLAFPVVAPAVLALVMQMVREQQSAASTSGRGVAAESDRRVISAAATGSAEEGTVLTASTSATAATGQTQRRATASAGLAARGQVEGPVATILSIIMTNAYWPPKRPNLIPIQFLPAHSGEHCPAAAVWPADVRRRPLLRRPPPCGVGGEGAIGEARTRASPPSP